MSLHAYGRSPRPWSKLKSRVEALFAPGLQLAIHCNVFTTVTKEFTFDEPRHWVVLGRGRAGRIIWDFPGPFLRPAPGKPPRSRRGLPLDYWESGYGLAGRQPSEPSTLMRDYLDRSRERLMEPFEDPWELAAILRAADRRLGRERLLAWAGGLEPEHPALTVIRARFGGAGPASGGAAQAQLAQRGVVVLSDAVVEVDGGLANPGAVANDQRIDGAAVSVQPLRVSEHHAPTR